MRLGTSVSRAAVIKSMVPLLDFDKLGPCAGGAGDSSDEEDEEEAGQNGIKVGEHSGRTDLPPHNLCAASLPAARCR